MTTELRGPNFIWRFFSQESKYQCHCFNLEKFDCFEITHIDKIKFKNEVRKMLVMLEVYKHLSHLLVRFGKS